MRPRPTVAAAVAAAGLVALAASPAGALAAPLRLPRSGVVALATDDDVPGDPIPASPFADSVDSLTDSDDVFALALSEGDVLEVRLSHEPGTHAASVWLFGPGTTSVWGGVPVDFSEGWVTDYFTYTVAAGEGGTYYLDVFGEDGMTVYLLEWTVDGATPISGVERFAGIDRYETAVAISRETFTSGSCTTAILATGQNFADALAASGLAGVMRCPVLLTMSRSLPTDEWDESIVVDEMRRLGVTRIFIVGGEGAVSPYVVAQLARLYPEGGPPLRIAGVTRYETARLVADEMQAQTQSGVREAFVVPGDNWPDALAASPFAYANRAAVLLTPRDSLDPGAEDFLATYCDRVTVVGGTLADDVESRLMTITPSGVVYAGIDRYDTAAILARSLPAAGYVNAFGYVGIATGNNYADALAGGVAAGEHGGVLLLTPSPPYGATLNPLTAGVMRDSMPPGADAFIYGGEGAIGRSTEAEVRDILSGL